VAKLGYEPAFARADRDRSDHDVRVGEKSVRALAQPEVIDLALPRVTPNHDANVRRAERAVKLRAP
jgi:hypothetical protein